MVSSKSKTIIDRIVMSLFLTIAIIAASSIVFIVLFILIKGISPFINVYQINGEEFRPSFWTFISSGVWNEPNYGAFGALINTIYITALATLIALPVSVLTALFIVRIAPKWLATIIKNIVELLAAIPSIVFGLFGSGIINPLVRDFATLIGVQTAGGQSVISTVIVLVIMMLPTITMLSITSMQAVRPDVINASLALGASPMQTNFKVVIGGAKSGIFAALILGVGRAMGEATAVSLVCGNVTSGPNFDLFGITRTLTSTMMLGLHESSGLNYDIRFSVGVLLIVLILVTNVGLNLIKRRMEKI